MSKKLKLVFCIEIRWQSGITILSIGVFVEQKRMEWKQEIKLGKRELVANEVKVPSALSPLRRRDRKSKG